MLDQQFIPRRIISAKGEKLDLFDDFVDNGSVEVWLRSIAPAQYFGMAQADMYLRAPDSYFTLNFIKGYIGIWLQMTLLIGMGVLFSTFLSGPVAILATTGAMLGGFFHTFLYEVAYQQTATGGQVFGGGPFESMLHMITQDNITIDLEPNLRTMVVQTLDKFAEPLMRVAVMLVPDFSRYSFSDYVAYGFNIPGDQILKFSFRMLAFVIPVFVAGLFCLKIARGCPMNSRTIFYRKITYLVAIRVLMVFLFIFGQPSTPDTPDQKGSPGGILAKYRNRENSGLSQTQLGQIDPTSETIKLSTFGLRGVAALVLWEKANDYKMKEDWANFAATLDQIIKVQPHFISVWIHQAWNMSYNVSVEFDDYREPIAGSSRASII